MCGGLQINLSPGVISLSQEVSPCQSPSFDTSVISVTCLGAGENGRDAERREKKGDGSGGVNKTSDSQGVKSMAAYWRQKNKSAERTALFVNVSRYF